MKPKVFVIFFATFLLQVVCIKASITFRNKKLDVDVPDVKEIQNMSKVLLDPLLTVQPYFTSENSRAPICFENENNSYKNLTNNLAASLRKEMVKIQNQQQGKKIYESLQTLIETLIQLGPYLETVVKGEHLNAVGLYIDATKGKIRKQCDDFLLAFYKQDISQSEIIKKIEEGIKRAYYEAERKSNKIIRDFLKCIKN